MSRLTDLETIARGIAMPLAWSRLAVVPTVTLHIEAAESIVFTLIYREEEAIERVRAEEEAYEARMREWRAREPEKPWQEDREYEDAMRAWRTWEPAPGPIPPPVK